jgi:hypothetical protein
MFYLAQGPRKYWILAYSREQALWQLHWLFQAMEKSLDWTLVRNSQTRPSIAIISMPKVLQIFTKNLFCRTYWKQAGVENKISLQIGPAVESMQNMVEKGESETFDFAFIDCDKSNYDNYYELSLKLLRQNGILAIDNTLWSGRVLHNNSKEASTLAIQALNDKIAKDSRVMAVQLNIADGLTLVFKK